jgi:HK97 family phage portal protein
LNLIDRALMSVVRWRTRAGMTALPSVMPLGGNPLPPLSHGYVHEPFPGAWQMNRECYGPGGIFSAVYACITIISGDVAKLPPKIRKRLPDGSKVDFENHPAARVLWYPNSYQTRVDFWGQFMASSLFTGSAYAYLIRDDRNVISEMHLLDPRKVTPLIAEDGSIFYRLAPDPLAGVPDAVIVPARFILHHRLLTLTHPLIGLTPLYAAGVSAMTGQTIQQNSFAFFSNMSRPSGVLTAPGKIDQDLATRLRTEWDQNFKGNQLGRTAVLGSGMKWEALAITAADAQLIEQLKFNVEDVARCFRVPTYMLADATTKMSFKNAEQLARNYYSQTLQYHIEAIEARIDTVFDLANDVFCEFDLSALLRMELDARMAAYQSGIQCGVLTINEARRMEELPPKTGGDEPLVQMQYRPLSMAGEPPDPTVPTDPEPDPPPEDDDPDESDDVDEAIDDESERAALVLLVRDRVRQRLAA